MTKLLIIQPSSLGGTVHGLQAAAALKAQKPDLHISWIVRDIFAPLVRASEVVDHTYVFHRNDGVMAFFRLMREVRETRFDYIFDFQGLLRNGLMLLRAHGGKKIGRGDAREGTAIFYNEKVPLPPDGKRSHPVEILLQFCRVFGLEPKLAEPLRFRDVDGLNLSYLGGPGNPRPVVMFPDSRRSDRRWNGFKQLTELIARDGTGRKVVWAGNNYVNCKDPLPERQFVNLTGNTSLVSLPALIKRAGWVISNDSGPMHLAAAFGVQTLGIFGPTDPRIYGPYPLTAPTNHVIQAPIGNLKLLTAKEVYARFQRLDGMRVRTTSPFPSRSV